MWERIKANRRKVFMALLVIVGVVLDLTTNQINILSNILSALFGG